MSFPAILNRVNQYFELVCSWKKQCVSVTRKLNSKITKNFFQKLGYFFDNWSNSRLSFRIFSCLTSISLVAEKVYLNVKCHCRSMPAFAHTGQKQKKCALERLKYTGLSHSLSHTVRSLLSSLFPCRL